MSTELLKRNAINYQLKVADPLQEICEPFFKATGIKAIRYFRQFYNGTYMMLGTESITNINFIDCFSSNTVKFERMMQTIPDDGKFHSLLWPSQPQDSLMQMFCDMNSWNGFSIYERLPDSLQTWSMTTDRANSNITNVYLEYKDFIFAFASYLAEKAAEIIKPERDRIVKLVNPGKIEYEKNLFVNRSEIAFLSKKLFSNKIQISTASNQKICLSKRQSECLWYTAHGKTAKEIAGVLGIGQRSVEDYLRIAKDKAECNYKSDLVDLYWRQQGRF